MSAVGKKNIKPGIKGNGLNATLRNFGIRAKVFSTFEANRKVRRIHIHLKFLFLDFVLVNNNRVPFYMPDTLTKIILTKRMNRLG